MQTWETDLLAELERLGEEEVRAKQLRTEFGSIDSQKYQFIEKWLRSKHDAGKSDAESRKELREEMNLSISRKALFNSRMATIFAAIATIIAMIAISDQFMRFLRWLGVLKP